ncbi:MAG TPA: recombinase family protein [Vicinamibacterales bacterium]|nr:recombinase family protein [Vicinamibacterales bacterium]
MPSPSRGSPGWTGAVQGTGRCRIAIGCITMRVACYARYSSDLQRATSLDDQLRIARRHAKSEGWTVEEDQIYTDPAASGSSIDGRPGLQALLAAVTRRPLPFDVLLVDDSSRIARDISDAIRVMQTLKFFGVRVIYISQHIDSADEQAETLVAVHGMVDSLYLREMAKKIRRGIEGQHARGFATGGKTFGYHTVPIPDPSGRREPNGSPAVVGFRVEIVPEEADVIRQIFEWYAGGLGNNTITARLNSAGTSGPRSQKRWKVNAVKRILVNERYLGRAIYGQRTFERRPGTRQKVARAQPRDQWRIQERPELRIISHELWERVRARQREVREAFASKTAGTLIRGKNAAMHSKHLFSGLLKCGVCGGAMTTVTGGHGSSRYGCPTSWRHGVSVCSNRLTIRAKIADAALVSGLQAELLRPETLKTVTEVLSSALNAVIDQRPKRRETLESAIANAERKLKHLVGAIEAGSSAPAVLQAITSREAEIVRLQAERDALDEPLDEKLAVIPSWVRQQLTDTAGLLRDTPERTKTAFRRMGVSFTLHPVHEDGQRPFLRAEGATDFAHVISGRFSVSTSGLSNPGLGR